MEAESTSKGTAKVSIARANYQNIATSGKHAIIIDEPTDLGGTDTGMNPFGLLLSSLGSCTAITMRMYIDRKMWVVDEISIALEIFEVADGNLIESSIKFKGELTQEQTERLLDIADKCPIHKILAGNIVMKSRLD